ncbi:MAG: FAD-binding protein [Pseudomonadota bacterium]
MTARSESRPGCELDLCDVIADAARTQTKLAITGGGSKAGLGRPAATAHTLDMRGFSGIIDYDPAELVLTVGAGTPLVEIQELVASSGQRLAFAPFDHGPIHGLPDGASTIGGVIGSGVAGSNRLSQGSARDHLLGFRAVSGRGEPFLAGAKVVKNVTGYDLSKLVTGSWGRLVALTEVTLKTLPRPRASITKAFTGLTVGTAVSVMSRALGSPADVAAACHIPGGLAGPQAMTLLRLEGVEPSVAARSAMLDSLLAEFGPAPEADGADADTIWAGIQTVGFLPRDQPLWRIHVAPRQAAAIAAALEQEGGSVVLDWAGGLIWLAFGGSAERVRRLAVEAGGHATLVRAPVAMRDAVPALHPPLPAVAALEERVRRAFDPAGVFETGRF